MEHLKEFIEIVAAGIEIIGVATIAIGSIYAIFRFLNISRKAEHTYTRLRLELGKAILLGLEFLVAADIIATVSADATLNRVLVLGLVVLIRTFLSITLQVELEGKFPWQKKTLPD
ncbi:MAG: DUF1622 domain-containing protein [Bacteroidales bacterium]